MDGRLESGNMEARFIPALFLTHLLVLRNRRSNPGNKYIDI